MKASNISAARAIIFVSESSRRRTEDAGVSMCPRGHETSFRVRLQLKLHTATEFVYMAFGPFRCLETYTWSTLHYDRWS